MSVQLILALDYPDATTALHIVDVIGEDCDFYKVGLELYTAAGPAIVDALRNRGKRVFLDLKFHDIPNTVRGAARSAARLGCEIMTVHVSGGAAMLAAALDGAREGSSSIVKPCKVFGVSVLTSLDAAGLAAIWGRSDDVKASNEVLRLASISAGVGLHGLVCSAHEAAAVRTMLAGQLELLVPGIRLETGERQSHDQARVATPRAARAAGADYLILGRAVSEAPDPLIALRQVRQSLR